MDQENFIPFSEQSLSLGALTVESSHDQLSFYGSIDITRDQQGLLKAHALQALLSSAIQQLEKEKTNLPEALPRQEAESVDNPF